MWLHDGTPGQSGKIPTQKSIHVYNACFYHRLTCSKEKQNQTLSINLQFRKYCINWKLIEFFVFVISVYSICRVYHVTPNLKPTYPVHLVDDPDMNDATEQHDNIYQNHFFDFENTRKSS